MKLIVLALAWLLGVGPPALDDSKQALASLQGEWELASETAGGEAMPMEKLRDRKLEFRGHKYMFKSPATGGEQGTFTCDPEQRPAALDMLVSEGPGKGKTRRAIYEIKEGNLRLCYTSPLGEPRPAAFTSERGGKTVLVVYRRVQP